MDADTRALQFVEEITTNAATVQEQVLAEILSRNADVEYLKRYNLDGATDPETFKSKIPVITYNDIKTDIQRLANGDPPSILLADPISEFLVSSGTTSGEQNFFPTTQDDQDRRRFLLSPSRAVMNRCGLDSRKRKVLCFGLVKPEMRTPGGHVAQPLSSSWYRNDQFKALVLDRRVFTSPVEAFICADYFQSMYAHILCSLLEREQISSLNTLFASGLLRAVKFLRTHWEDLANDIETATLNHPDITDSSIKEAMAKILIEPLPEIAGFIRTECSNENWEGIITRIWPNAKVLEAIATGSMSQYIPMRDYYSGGLPIASQAYAASELCLA